LIGVDQRAGAQKVDASKRNPVQPGVVPFPPATTGIAASAGRGIRWFMAGDKPDEVEPRLIKRPMPKLGHERRPASRPIKARTATIEVFVRVYRVVAKGRPAFRLPWIKSAATLMTERICAGQGQDFLLRRQVI
jgi:hypothetical protein